MIDPTAPLPPTPPPGRYGSLTVLPEFEPRNVRAEELTWPVVDYSVHPPRLVSPGQPRPTPDATAPTAAD